MKKLILFLIILVLALRCLFAQIEPNAGRWKTWFIESAKDVGLPAPPALPQTKEEGNTILSMQQRMDDSAMQKVLYWNAGAPSYRWRRILREAAWGDTTESDEYVFMLLDVAIYDAIVAAWNIKYAYKRLRPFEQDKRIKALIVQSNSPSYPCEYSVAAGVASTLISHFYPQKADSVNKLVKDEMNSRVLAGVQYPSDTKAGFELGKNVALKALEKTKNYLPAYKWDGKIPDRPGLWNGKKPSYPLQGKWKTMVLTSASQFRPGPPPNYKKEMEELKNFKPTRLSTAIAFEWAYGSVWEHLVEQKLFEYNLHLNPPRAERIYALRSTAIYDAEVACWDAKYTYWGIRPEQYDTTFHPSLMYSPSFPGYPSGHAVIAGALAPLLSELFPMEKKLFWEMANEAAESRFEGGVHFRSDNTVGLEMGKKIGELMVQRAKADGADGGPAAKRK